MVKKAPSKLKKVVKKAVAKPQPKSFWARWNHQRKVEWLESEIAEYDKNRNL